jgi:hypothetical protein
MPYPDLLLAVSLVSDGASPPPAGHSKAPEKLVACHSFILVQHSKCFEQMLGTHRHMLRVHPTGVAAAGAARHGHGDVRQIELFTSSYRTIDQMLCWMYQGIDVTAGASFDHSAAGGGSDITTTPSPSHSHSVDVCLCATLQEVVDLLLLANEFLVTRLQLLCEHRIGQLLGEFPHTSTSSEAYLTLTLQLGKLGEALHLTTLLSYVLTWSSDNEDKMGNIKIKNKRSKKKRTTTSQEQLRVKQELGYLDNKNADFPFILLVLLERVRRQENIAEGALATTSTTSTRTTTVRYLECFLALVTDNADNYYSRSYDVLDVLVEAFPVILSDDDPLNDCCQTSEVRGKVTSELDCFHVHNKLQRLYMLQSILMLSFSSLLELAVFVLAVTEGDREGAPSASAGGSSSSSGVGGGGGAGLADRLTKKF